jgi:hypothetical protein
VHDYFTEQAPTAPAPVEEPAAAEPVETAQIEAIPLMAPAPAPVEEAVVAELPAMAPPEPAPAPAPEPEPVLEPAALAAETIELPAYAPEAEIAPAPIEAVVAAVEPVSVVEPVAAPELEELFAAKRSDFRVVVRLKEGEGVDVGSFRDFGTAMEGAQEVIEQFSTAAEGQWPFYAGRFIRPDLIVSVDVVEGDSV